MITRFQPHDFRKATRSQPDRDCVQVARRGEFVEVRDSKTTFGAPDDVRLRLTASQFDAFLAGIRAGELAGHGIDITVSDDGAVFRSTTPHEGSQVLTFTHSELAAFFDGVQKNEFAAEAFAPAG